MIIAADIRDTLWHTATFTPPAATTVDVYNQPVQVAGTPVTVVPCRVRDATSRDIYLAQIAGIQKIDYVVTLGLTPIVGQRSQITNFRDHQNISVLATILTVMHSDIRKLLDQPLFQILYCQKVG